MVRGHSWGSASNRAYASSKIRIPLFGTHLPINKNPFLLSVGVSPWGILDTTGRRALAWLLFFSQLSQTNSDIYHLLSAWFTAHSQAKSLGCIPVLLQL